MYTTIKKSSNFFNTNLYTGNNTETSHTVGFQPDFTWLKVRNGSGGHYLFDAIRGATKNLRSDATNAEATDPQTLKSFDSNGYTIGTSNSVNTNNETMVGWNWKANGAGSANTDGSISSTVSASATSGFSIVKWSGTASNATVGHGLGAVPKMIIFKNLSDSYYWVVYHQGIGNTAFLSLNENSASSTSLNMFQNYTPTDDVFYVSSQGYVNGGGGNQMIAYCFAEKQGYSKFGSYVGNGNADGTFVYTGFKPAFVMIKETDAIGNWCMSDNKRDGYNPTKTLYAMGSGVEVTENIIDHYSNGFKIRSTDGSTNTSGSNHIYMAFAEEPLVGDNPATAR